MILKFGYVKNKRWYAIFSHIIRLYERLNDGIDANHCYVELISESVVYRVESVYPHGKITLNGNFSKKYDDVETYLFRVDENIEDAIKWCKQHIEKKEYSIMQNIYLVFANLLSVLCSSVEFVEYNGRHKQNCTEAQIMILAKFLNIYPTEGLDNFSIKEAHQLVKDVYMIRGLK
jgi:hypothetical protein